MKRTHGKPFPYRPLREAPKPTQRSYWRDLMATYVGSLTYTLNAPGVVCVVIDEGQVTS